MAEALKILLLGGTSEGAELNRRLSQLPGLELVTSLAGATGSPGKLTGNILSGGFGGARGLADYVKAHQTDLIVDATHPYADKISNNTFAAADANHIALMRLVRPAWKAARGDQWIYVQDMAAAAKGLTRWSRPFLSIGRKGLDCFSGLEGKRFLVRSIEKTGFEPAHSSVHYIEGRGPFHEADEMALMKTHRTDVLVTKNSGGPATYGKVAAARNLGLPVIMIDRPAESSEHQYRSVDEVVAAIAKRL